MALIFSGISAVGRVRFNNPLTANAGVIVLFPTVPLTEVRYKGGVEVLSLNTPLQRYVQKEFYPLWVDSVLIPSAAISNSTHRLSFVWRLAGIPFEVHTT